MLPLAQPPRKDDNRFDDWVFLLWRRITSVAGIAWSIIDKTGSNLTDIETRNHADLQNINTASYTHLSSTNATDLTDGTDSTLHYHATDRDLANASGILTSVHGGTDNGFTKFTGPTTAEKIFTLPDASATLLYSGGAGDASNLTGTAAGLTAGIASTVTVADAASDATTWPMLATSQTGNMAPATDAGLTYDASANTLVTTAFVSSYTSLYSIDPTTLQSFQAHGNSGTVSVGLGAINWRSNNVVYPVLSMAKSYGNVVGTQSVVADNAVLGAVEYYGSDGTDFIKSAQILSIVDGTPSAGVMPTQLDFRVNTGGGATPTNMASIFPNGAIHFGGLSTTDRARVIIGNSGAPKDVAFGGPILTLSTLVAGSGYTDGAYTDVALSYSTGAMGSVGLYGLVDITVAGGVVTVCTLKWGGLWYYEGDVLTVSNALIGGTGSGFTITVATVDKATLSLISYDASGVDRPKIRLMQRDPSLAANQLIGDIAFQSNDTTAKAMGDVASIHCHALSTSGGAYFTFHPSAAGVANVETLRIDSEGIDVTGAVSTTTQFVSTIATGTAPLTVASTTEVANLKAATATLAATATIASTITVADTASATCYIGMYEAASGSLAAKTDTGLTYDATTGILTATGIAGVSPTGHGVVAQGDTTTPAKSAFRVVPQNAAPTGPNEVGDIYVTTAGVPQICTVAGSPGTWGDFAAAGPGGGSTVTTTEVDLGTVPKTNGSFQITGSGFTVGKPILITQAALAYTGKGTYTDEIEMDQINVGGYVLNSTTLNCNWGCWTKVKGNVKFNYMIGA